MPAHRTMRWIALAAVAASLGPGPGPAKEPEVPPINRKVAEFAREHVGEQVGDGVCTTLAREALRAGGAKRMPLDDPAGDYVWGRPIDSMADALPGDVLQFRDAIFKGKKSSKGQRVYWELRYAHHTAIVARVADKGKTVTIWHQNVATRDADPDDRRKVQETTLQMRSLQPGGEVHIFRPIGRSEPDPGR